MQINENDIQRIYERMQFTCFGALGHRRILDLFPNRVVSADAHLEFDHFLLYEDICVIGEISGLSDKRDVETKYKRFCEHVSILREASNLSEVLCKFNIPLDRKYLFNRVRQVSSFFIAGKHEKYDVDIRELSQVPVLYASDWRLVCSYVDSIGKYAQYPFLKLVGIAPKVDLERDLTFHASKNLLTLDGRFLFRDSDVRASVLTFRASPNDLLEVAEVFRRELMPVIEDSDGKMYQRPLDPKKLEQMRSLVANPDFMFPSPILLALDENCHVDRTDSQQDILRIPMRYGSISVIDGQHRLFSYASEAIPDNVRQQANILTTALIFDTKDPQTVLRCAANTFVEINQTQKKISSAHLDEIAYSVLGRTYPRALAAQVIFRANRRPSHKPLSGLFRSRQTTGGVIEAATVISALHPLTNLESIQKLLKSRRTSGFQRGYLNLLSDIGRKVPTSAEELIETNVAFLEAYFGKVQRVFDKDWAALSSTPVVTALSYTKVFAAFVRLLRELIKEGFGSQGEDESNIKSLQFIEEELKKIKINILELCQSQNRSIIFAITDPHIPTDRPSDSATMKFLNANRKSPTSIQRF